MKRKLDNFLVEVWLRNKKTFKIAPITINGEHHNAYDIFKDDFIKALENGVDDIR